MFARSGQQFCLNGETAGGWREQKVGSLNVGSYIERSFQFCFKAEFSPFPILLLQQIKWKTFKEMCNMFWTQECIVIFLYNK